MAAASTLIALADLNKGKDGWDGQVVFNASLATGNTENTVLGARFDIARQFGQVTHAFEAGGDYTETLKRIGDTEDRQVTQNRWFTQYRVEVQTGDSSFVYGRARYGEDQFSGFDRQGFLGAGIGHTLVKNDKTRLTILVGPGYQYLERARPETPGPDFERREGTAAVFIGQTFRRVIRENVTFEQSIDATVSDRNMQVNSNMDLRTKLTKSISTRINYAVIHNSDPPDGREQTDTRLSASIGYEF